MADRDVDVLKQARENFVRKRRAMAEQMVPSGAATAHFAPSFIDLQNAIEAIDRAMADEERLPFDYAAPHEEEPEGISGASGSNVVDFDQT